jgi:hypothetical protein
MGVPLGVPTRLHPHRVGTIDASSIEKVVTEEFHSSGRLVLTKSSNPAFFKDGELSFPPGGGKPDGSYLTRFGPCFDTNAVRYARSNTNMRYGMRRLTGVRKPEIKGLHKQLCANQLKFIDDQKSFLDYLSEKYTPYFSSYLGAEEEMYKHYDDPHEKRALRVQAHDEMIEAGTCCRYNDIWLRDVLWKIKPEEWAKFGKKPRCICDLGVSASLRGFILTSLLKQAQNDEPIEYEGGTFAFCKSPDPFALKRHFELLRNPPGRFYFLYFSDDSCLSIRDEHGDVQWFNLDISSCDASQGPGLFKALINLMPTDSSRHDMKALTKQCKALLRVVSFANKEHKIKLKPREELLMSGSTLTTGINNLASMLIALSIVRSYKSGPVGVENQTMVDAAAKAGYLLTGCTPLEYFEDVQFLKHSPVQDSKGEWHPMLNLGVLYRASGTCKGDLPGSKKTSLAERGTTFQRSLLRGAYPYLSFDILNNMRATSGPGLVYPIKEFQWKVTEGSDKYPHTFIPHDSIVRRYRLEWHEYLELLETANYGYGWFFNNTGASKVLTKDYDLECTEDNPIPYVTGHSDDFGHTCALVA